jgi:hypothetical protein
MRTCVAQVIVALQFMIPILTCCSVQQPLYAMLAALAAHYYPVPPLPMTTNCCHYCLLQLSGQAVVRGWFKRRVAAKERAKRLLSLRGHLFELWKRAHSPLLHRSKFWTLFQGGGLLDLAVHEVHTNIVLAHYSSILYLMLCKGEACSTTRLLVQVETSH